MHAQLHTSTSFNVTVMHIFKWTLYKRENHSNKDLFLSTVINNSFIHTRYFLNFQILIFNLKNNNTGHIKKLKVDGRHH